MKAIQDTFFQGYRGRWFTIRKVALVAVLLALPVPAFALTLEWDRNTEPDMKEYNIYGCDTGTTCTIPTVKIGAVTQPPIGIIPSFAIPANKEGRRSVTAIDTSGNESAVSVSVPFDVLAPTVPLNPRLK